MVLTRLWNSVTHLLHRCSLDRLLADSSNLLGNSDTVACCTLRKRFVFPSEVLHTFSTGPPGVNREHCFRPKHESEKLTRCDDLKNRPLIQMNPQRWTLQRSISQLVLLAQSATKDYIRAFCKGQSGSLQASQIMCVVFVVSNFAMCLSGWLRKVGADDSSRPRNCCFKHWC